MLGIYENEKQWQLLRKSFFVGKLSHGYLFSGPPGLGKKETARALARLVNCQNPVSDQRPCISDFCPSCREFEKQCHPDFLWLEKPAEEESQINALRDLTGWLFLRPALSDFKIAIINQVEGFSLPAQSALLKTLEEPPAHSLLLLISENPSLLPRTIISRLQEIKFRSWPTQKLFRSVQLKSPGIEAGSIAAFGLGSPAIVSGFTKESLALQTQRLQDFRRGLGQGLSSWFRAAELMSASRAETLQGLTTWLNFGRQVFLAGLRADKKELGLMKSRKFLSALLQTYELIIKTNVNSRLAVENAILVMF